MAQTINTNIASLTAQRNLAASQKDAATAMQRLSSGLRINSAKDDAAGLAIANRLTAQINGINQAVRNANDAISVVSIAEGALAESTDILQRMRELSVQAANASNSADDRTNLQTEVSALVLEMDRIANTTSFGETKLLNGSFTSQAFQVGANGGESMSVSISSARTANLGTLSTAAFTGWDVSSVSADATTATDQMAAQTLTFNVDSTDYTVAVAAGASSRTVADSINVSVPKINATAKTGVLVDDFTMTSASGTATVTVNDTALTGVDVTSAANFFSDVASKGGAAAALSGLTFTATGTNITITNETGDDIKFALGAVTASTATLEVTALEQDGTTEIGTAVELDETKEVIVKGDIDFTTSVASGSTITVKSDVASDAGIANTAAGSATLSTNASRVSTIDITTVSGALAAVNTLDSALDSLATQRASLGASASRLDSVVSNLQNVAENSAAAKSRIMDADFAQETAQLAKTQILQQAGISVLAQANAQPQNVLALLQ
jgi:flagellin